jgi:hypothetical protein
LVGKEFGRGPQNQNKEITKSDPISSAGEYVSMEDPTIHTNTVESYFSIFKRGMKGIYQHCAKKHLHRYLAEFDFRYNRRASKDIDDSSRAEKMLDGVVGKRLTYQTTNRKTEKGESLL